MNDYLQEEHEVESKVDIEEAFVNLNCVKEEPHEGFDLRACSHVERYKVTLKYENIFGESSYKIKFEEDDNLIGFGENDVVMEHAAVMLDGIKVENVNFDFYCSRCKEIYKGYCVQCSTLSHILNNVPLANLEPELKTTPADILEIRKTSLGKGVYLLKSLPKDIIFGPFDGISAIKTTEMRYRWKTKDGKLVNIENGNWMKNICAANALSKNLDIMQIDGKLYFRTNREIREGEELLVYYDDEEIHTSSDSEECYFVPKEGVKVPKIFACMLCCLGFGLDKCLMEHKSKCPHAADNRSIKDFELVECQVCNLWLEKQEHEAYHMEFCWQNHHKLCHNIPAFRRQPADEIDDTPRNTERNYEISTPIDENRSYLTVTGVMRAKYSDEISKAYRKKKHKCSVCSYQTTSKDHLKVHLNTHNHIKKFECDICKQIFKHKGNLKFHIKNKHSNIRKKVHKCSKCSFETNYKISLSRHLNAHNDIKAFECDVCKQRFTQKSSLKQHITAIHSNIGEKEYKCSECSYQTNRKHNLKAHLNAHNDIKHFQCDTCKQRFGYKSSLKFHIRNQHLNTSDKEYKCSECSYQTNHKSSLKTHFNTHNDIKHFQCDICKQRFGYKGSLRFHIRTQHLNTSEEECK